MQITPELLNNVVEYIGQSNEIIQGLQKRAEAAELRAAQAESLSKTASVKQALNEAEIKKTAAVLISAQLLKKEAEERFISDSVNNPDTVLMRLSKLAEFIQSSKKRDLAVSQPGMPVASSAPAVNKQDKPDRAKAELMKEYGFGSSR